ncbi:unnamed protein product [Cylicostephanus goldi]|uniref:Cell cycle checkpoint protein RAD1 n=1 Tax=Cylicostephanus goldi TaxID=71465 RepID=A0A3P6QYW4_CYLGO|nr:unnamed protein product [Cylicostephanus goldi]
MQMASGDARTDQAHLLELKKAHVRDLGGILKAISFCEFIFQSGTFQATPQGMRIIVDDNHCEQAIAYLSNDLFSCFNLREQTVLFRVPLNVINECIGMHTGSGATLKMTYDGFGEPLKLILEEDGIVVDMSVQTLDTQEVRFLRSFFSVPKIFFAIQGTRF